MHSGQDSGGFVCSLLGAFVMDGKQFGWVAGHRRGDGGAVERFISDNATGLINEMQVTAMLGGSSSGSGRNATCV
jgi:hypothetical protein